MTKTEEIFKLTAPYNNQFQGEYKKLLFVCSAGILRSATASTIASKMGYNARSCGSENYALIPISKNLIFWADHIFFMKTENFKNVTKMPFDDHTLEIMGEKSTVWNIDDNFDYMHHKLVTMIEVKLQNYGEQK